MIRLGRRALGAAFVLPALGACGMFRDTIALRSIAFRVAEGANENSAIPVDLVLISDDTVVPPIIALTAAEWFQRREQFQRDFPSKLRVMNFELVPGSTVAARPVSRSPRPVAAIVFANYQVAGAHRLRVNTERDLVVVLGERGGSLTQ